MRRSGWNAVAVGPPGTRASAMKAASEQNAINDALGDCAKRDSDCHVIAIGPFVGRAEQLAHDLGKVCSAFPKIMRKHIWRSVAPTSR